MRNLEEFCYGAQEIVRVFDEFIRNNNLAHMGEADHICYKCGSLASYESLRSIFEKEGAWVYQAIIAGRRIATIRIKKPITTSLGNVSVIELSDQKPDGSQTDGFDHIEVYPTSGSYEELVSRLQDRGLEVKEISRPHHTTHDIRMNEKYIFRLTHEPLVKKIVNEMSN